MNNPRKIVVVTGGSGLIGKAIVDECIKHSYIVINFDKTAYDIEELDNRLIDITDYDSVNNELESIIKKYGQLDGFVNNAYPKTSDWGIPLEDDDYLNSWRNNVDLQLNSYVMCTKLVINCTKNQSNLSVINMSSIYGVVGNDMSLYTGTKIKPVAAYSAIKGALINFTRFMASQHGKKGFRFNCVSPGGIFDHQDPIFVDNYKRKVPMGRMGTPRDIAPSVRFLLGDGSKYITGQNIIVDGGWTCI